MKICLICAKPLSGRQQRYCTPLCASRAFNAARTSDGRLKEQRAKHSDKRKEWFESAKESRECVGCGKIFMVYRYAKSQHCSRRCINRPSLSRQISVQRKLDKAALGTTGGKRVFVIGRCFSCGLDTCSAIAKQSVSTHAIYCSPLCSWREGTARRRARGFTTKVTKEQRYKVFERDQWKCQICGDPVNFSPLSPTAPDAPVVDHVMPLAKGGSHSLQNWQTAHYYCNGVKGARVGFVAVI